MSDISDVWNFLQAAVMSKISRFLDMCEPLQMKLNRQFESTNSCSWIQRAISLLTSLFSVTAASLMAANPITSPSMAERGMRRDL